MREGTDGTERESLLSIALSAAVPLHILRLKEQGGPRREDIEACQAWSTELGEHGDVLLFGGGKPGQAAALFNQLARSIAVLSFWPGGVSLFGQHWESVKEEEERAAQDRQ